MSGTAAVRTITRSSVDRIDIHPTPSQDWRICEFTPAASNSHADAWISPAAIVDQITDIDGLLGLTRYRYLAADAPDVFDDQPIETVRHDTNGDQPFVHADVLRLTIDEDDTIDPARIVAFDGWDHALLRPGSDVPAARVVTVNSHLLTTGGVGEFDINAAREILDAHPWVVRTEETRNWDGSALRFDVRVPDGEWAALCQAKANRRRQSRHPRGRTTMMPNLEELLTWAVPVAATGESNSPEPWWCEATGPDPLGLAPAWTGAA